MTTTSASGLETSAGPAQPPPARGRILDNRNIKKLAQLGPVVALVLLAGFFAIQAPQFTTAGNLTNVLQQVSMTAVAAVGATVVTWKPVSTSRSGQSSP